MAAFCGCCGAEITPKAEACPVCGTPRHGMSPVAVEAGAQPLELETTEDSESTLTKRCVMHSEP